MDQFNFTLTLPVLKNKSQDQTGEWTYFLTDKVTFTDRTEGGGKAQANSKYTAAKDKNFRKVKELKLGKEAEKALLDKYPTHVELEQKKVHVLDFTWQKK